MNTRLRKQSMELLAEIQDKAIEDASYLKIRHASRAVLFDEKGLIPLLFVSKHRYHKLPGGGVKEGEDKKEALTREVFEEVGCEFIVTGEVGRIIEYRSKFNLYQTSYCYVGNVISKGTPSFTESELSDGFQLVWLSLDNAIAQVESERPTDYEGSFVQKRDIVFLKTARQRIEAYQ